MSGVRLAAVVVTHQGGPLLDACLRSLRAQSRPPDELIVVVSNRAIAVDAPALQLGENVGYARAANAGAVATTGEVLLLNDDTCGQQIAFNIICRQIQMLRKIETARININR